MNVIDDDGYATAMPMSRPPKSISGVRMPVREFPVNQRCIKKFCGQEVVFAVLLTMMVMMTLLMMMMIVVSIQFENRKWYIND